MSATGTTTAATIASSTGQRLAAIAWRAHAAGPDAVLHLMRTALTSSDVMGAFERIGAAALPLPSRPPLISDRKPQPPILRVVK